MATNGNGPQAQLIPANLPPWEAVCHGGTIDMAVLVGQPALRHAAASFGSPLPTKVKRAARVPANSPIGEQLRSLYCSTLDIIQQSAILHGTSTGPGVPALTPAQFDEALRVYKEQQGLPQPATAADATDSDKPVDREELRQRLRSSIASKRYQRTGRPPERK